MRKIDFEKPFTEGDVAWLRQAGFMSEERIAHHQAQFDAKVPEVEVPEDASVQSALDPEARMRGEFVGAESAPINVTPVEPQAGDANVDEFGLDPDDDYDAWKVSELKAEVEARNEIAAKREDVTTVEVVGTGADGAIRKVDYVKALRFWDNENPGVLENDADKG